jgi:hypothetical protein
MWEEAKIESVLKEFPLANWPMVDIKKQDTMFFAIIRKLKAFDLDPKYHLESKHVRTKDSWFLFGGSRKIKMKSHGLKLEDKVGMEEIYYRVFGTTSIANYEMLAWIMRGFIVESKGIDINWANVVESIAKEKAHRDEVKSNERLGVMKKEQTINISKSGGSMIANIEVKVSQLAPYNPRLEDASFAPLEDDIRQSSYIVSQCPSGVLVEYI